MENLKLISVRIDPETLRKVDALKAQHPYWKRNAIINGLLTAIVDAMDDKSLYDMVRYCRIHHESPFGYFCIDKKHAPTLVPNSRNE